MAIMNTENVVNDERKSISLLFFHRAYQIAVFLEDPIRCWRFLVDSFWFICKFSSFNKLSDIGWNRSDEGYDEMVTVNDRSIAS